ncbi:MAG TPA: porin [Dongiaceae bacterium]|nr:porin [Dongiaceae bacterium]
MKVRLLPLAVAAAIAAPGVALADGPTVYGRLNVSYEMTDVDNGVDSADRWELNSNSSRLGVKGDAAINDRLKAIYQAEFGINVDDGATTVRDSEGESSDHVLSQRDIFVGLTGGWGTVLGGKFDTPLKKAQGKVDQFNDLSGDIQYIFVGENRTSNNLQYSTPAMGGFQFNLAAMPGEEFDNGVGSPADPVEEKDGPADAFSTSVTFTQDMIYAALAYDSEVASTLYGGITPGYGYDSDGEYFDTIRAVGVLTLDALQLGLMYQTAETSDASELVADDDYEQDGFLLSASFKIQQIVLKGQYGATTLTDNEVDVDLDAEQVALGLDYLMSKQTTAFVYYNMLSYEVDVDDEEEQTKDNFGVGLVHNF